MKAVVVHAFTPFDRAGVEDVDDPRPGPGEVLVSLEASDANFPDILYIEGKYQSAPAFPFSPGLAGAGTVIELGEGVEKPSLGDRVLVIPDHGTYAEKIAVPAAHCFPMPDNMPFVVAAAFGLVYQTAWFALNERGGLKMGDTVLVLGATGGIGMACVQLAKALGAATVMAVSRGEEGCRIALEMGADVAIDGFMDDPRAGLRDAVMGATGGHGADVVVDPIGGDLSAAALRAMAWQGRMVIVGFAAGAIPQIPANYLLVKTIAVSGLQWTDYRERTPAKVRAAQETIFRFWSEGRLEPRISAVLPLERYADALHQIKRGQGRGKVILSTGPDRHQRSKA